MDGVCAALKSHMSSAASEYHMCVVVCVLLASSELQSIRPPLLASADSQETTRECSHQLIRFGWSKVTACVSCLNWVIILNKGRNRAMEIK